MLILGIDTSGPLLSVALAEMDERGSLVKTCVEELAGRKHAERLPIVCDDVLKKVGATYSDLKGIVIGKGPGSFTGLRIGFGYAKGIACALHIPVCAISSFAAYALADTRSQVILGDARSKLYFYSDREEAPQLKTEEELKSIFERSEATHIISFDTFSEELIGRRTVLAPTEIARHLLRLVSKENFASMSTLELSAIAPDYLRPAAAKTIAERLRAGA